jgi:uncharacterized membrane protein YidH (DUF202 family)
MSDRDWHQEETYKSLILFGDNALKFVLLINGGAVIALLTFLGNLLKIDTVSMHMGWPMGCFLTGIIVGGLANITAYYTQLMLFNESVGNKNGTIHMTWLYITIAFVVLGVLLFGIGSILTLLELQSYT